LIDQPRDHAGVKAERAQQLFCHTIAARGREHRQRDTERAIRRLTAGANPIGGHLTFNSLVLRLNAALAGRIKNTRKA
jgi:hypothetical protein